jgi:RimJ/RimL family protein N-acetyltransferase
MVVDCPFPIINAVLDHRQKGAVYSIAHSTFILHKSAFSFLSAPGESYDEIIDFFISSEEIPGYFHIYDASEKLIAACENRSEALNIKVRHRVQLQYRKPNHPAIALGDGVSIEGIDGKNFDSLSVFNLDLGNKFWGGREDFLQNGLGVCLFKEAGRPATVCYAASIARGIAEIDIATLPEYRQMGFAKEALKAFIQNSLAMGITPNWDCFTDNTASLKTAQALGFSELKRYVFLSVFNKHKTSK